MECIFCKIIDGKTESEVILQNKYICAFRDINPAAPSHILIVPNEHLTSIEALSGRKINLAGRLLLAVKEVARLEGISKTGYRIIANTGSDSHQEVPHLHIHVLGGAPMQQGLG